MLKYIIRTIVVVVVLGSAAYGWYRWNGGSSYVREDETLYLVQAGIITSTVTETGEVRCRDALPMSCMLDGVDNKIIFLVKQGDKVKQGDVVVRFDSSALKEKIASVEKEVNTARQKVQEIQNNLSNQENKNENLIKTATNAVENKILILEKYEQCDFDIRVLELKSEIASSTAELDRRKEEAQKIDRLVKKGFRTTRQRQEKQQLVAKAQAELDRDRQKLTAFQDFEHTLNLSEKKEELSAARRKLKETKIDADLQIKKITYELESAQENLRLLQKDHEYLLSQLSNCEILANSDGVVKYIDEDYSGEKNVVGLGKSARLRQELFYILNENEMLIRCTLDDTDVRKAQVGQNVFVRAHSHQDVRISGVVEHISVLSTYNGNGTQGYQSTISLEELPAGVELNPGVEADIEIVVGSKTDVLFVPVTSVCEYLGKHYVFVKSGSAFRPTEVQVGMANDAFVETVAGVAANSEIALNCQRIARQHFPASYLHGAKMKSELISRILDQQRRKTDDGNDVARHVPK